MRRTALAVLVALALAAAGCSGGGGDGVDRAGRATGAPGPAGPEVERPRRGGVLRVGVERPASFDPALARSVPQTDLVVADLLFDGLTDFDPGAGEAVPALALSWESSDDLRRWTFRLDAARRFADGSPVTADDVRFSLERVRALAERSEAAVLLAGLEGVDAVGGAVRIRLRDPMATLPLLLASPLLGVVQRAQVEGDAGAFASLPVGSGPFSLGERDGDTLRLERAPGSSALLDGVELHLFDDAATSYAAFRSGDLDWSLVPSDSAASAVAAGHGRMSPYRAVLFYGINLRNPVFADRRFREAIVRAVDRAEIAEEVYGGTLAPRAGVSAGGLPGAAADPCGGRCEHDPAEARRLVAETFGERPVHTVHVDFDAGGRQEQVAGMIVAALREAGIPAEARPRPFEEYAAFVVSGEQAVFRLGWTGGYPSAEAYLAPLFRSGAPDNVTGLAQPEVDAALDAIRTEERRALRVAALADLERSVMQRYPVLPIGQFRTAWAVSERVRGLDMAVDGTFEAGGVWVASGS